MPTGEGGLCNADESKKYLAMSYAFLVAFYQNHKSLESAQKSLMSMVRKGDIQADSDNSIERALLKKRGISGVTLWAEKKTHY